MPAPKRNTIAVDLDGTLAKHEEGQEEIGEPIQPMMDRVKQWDKDGHTVRIHTARMNFPGQFPKIKAWLREHGLDHLPVTNQKKGDESHYYDDRAVAVERNTGRILGGEGPHEDWDAEARKEIKE
jgi:hypothetical protein